MIAEFSVFLYCRHEKYIHYTHTLRDKKLGLEHLLCGFLPFCQHHPPARASLMMTLPAGTALNSRSSSSGQPTCYTCRISRRDAMYTAPNGAYSYILPSIHIAVRSNTCMTWPTMCRCSSGQPSSSSGQPTCYTCRISRRDAPAVACSPRALEEVAML